MRFKLAITALAATLVPFFSQAAVTLHLSDNVEMVAYNGQQHTSSLFGSQKDLVLENGTQQLAFRYVTSFKKGKDQTNFQSDVMVVKFDAQDTGIHFDFPAHRTEKQARAFNKNPSWQLLDSDNKTVPFTQGKLLKKGVQFGRDFLSELARFNATSHPASLQNQPVQLPVKTGAVATETGTQNEAQIPNEAAIPNEAEQQLHLWYEKADEATRLRFKTFVNQS